MSINYFNSNNIIENTSICKIVSLLSNVHKTAHAEQCAKSRALDKFIYSIHEIESFEQKCVIIKGLSQSEQLK